MAIEGTCGQCLNRAYRSDGGCKYSPGDLPMIPNHDQKCPLTPSRFEKDHRREQYGRVITPPESTNPYPQHGEIRSHPPEPTGFSDIVRLDGDGNPGTYRVKDGKVYSLENKYIGTMDEVFPPGPSLEELAETHKRVKAQLLKEYLENE